MNNIISSFNIEPYSIDIILNDFNICISHIFNKIRYIDNYIIVNLKNNKLSYYDVDNELLNCVKNICNLP